MKQVPKATGIVWTLGAHRGPDPCRPPRVPRCEGLWHPVTPGDVLMPGSWGSSAGRVAVFLAHSSHQVHAPPHFCLGPRCKGLLGLGVSLGTPYLVNPPLCSGRLLSPPRALEAEGW